MSDRERVIQAVEQMSDSATFDEILDQLRLLESVEKGLAQSEAGEGIPHRDVPALLDQWITKSSGHRAA